MHSDISRQSLHGMLRCPVSHSGLCPVVCFCGSFQESPNYIIGIITATWSLAVRSISGAAIATFSSFIFALPEYDAACAIRQSIILTCISLLMGLIITVARVWSIGCLMSPAISCAPSSSDEDEVKVDKVQLARTKLLNVLSKMSGWTLVVGSCGRYRSKGVTSNTLCTQVTLIDSMRVTAGLLLPQVILQIINLSVPSIRNNMKMLYEPALRTH